MLTLLLIGMLTLAFDTQLIKAGPKTIYVDDDNTAGPWDGTPEHPYANITSGLEHAVDGDTIFVYNGTYYEHPEITKWVKLQGENNNATIIDGQGIQDDVLTVPWFNYINVTISGFTIQNTSSSYYAINIMHDAHALIENNIMKNGRGIRLDQNSDNRVYNNALFDTGPGIFVENSANNIIAGNTIRNTRSGSTAINLFGSSSTGNIVHGNLIDSNYGYADIAIQGGASGNTISANNITNNQGAGIGIFYSTGNIVYHNNIINNTIQAMEYDGKNTWHNGYPFGGNYWSDYTNGDIYRGEYQNETGSDGIGDTPYVIKDPYVPTNEDKYPLMNPWGPNVHDVIVTSVTPLETVILEGQPLNITVDVSNTGYSSETFNATTYANTTQIGKQTVTNLNSGANKILSFTWDTTGWALGNYTISANATILPDETDTADNSYIDDMVTVRLPIYDIAVTDVVPSKTVVGQCYPISINVTVENQGNFTETFNVTAYANATQIGKKTVTNLNPGANKVLNFTWDTTGFTIGNYTISANATHLSGETDTIDNTYVDGTVQIVPRDVAITNVWPSKYRVDVGKPVDIHVKVENQGPVAETFDVTVALTYEFLSYITRTIDLETQTITLSNGTSTILTFSWEPTYRQIGWYRISANATQLPCEIDTADNTYVDGKIAFTPERVLSRGVGKGKCKLFRGEL
jgi:parallel beta-helix repeat protein